MAEFGPPGAVQYGPVIRIAGFGNLVQGRRGSGPHYDIGYSHRTRVASGAGNLAAEFGPRST